MSNYDQTYPKFTIITGRRALVPTDWDLLSIDERTALIIDNPEMELFAVSRPGYWKTDTAARLAKRVGMIGEVSVTHYRDDLSGKGRSGADHKFTVVVE